MALSEFELIERYFTGIGARRDDVILTVGDDAALVAPHSGRRLALSTDTLVAGVHFPVDAPAEAVGYKALAVNLSDLAAMAAEPAWLLLALTLPRADPDWLERFAGGLAALANGAGMALVGGDISRGQAITVTVQVAGYADRPLRRDGARPGDGLYVSGTLGDAALGLQFWQGGQREGVDAHFLIERLHRPTPRTALARALADLATAAIDVSDGLLADAAHLAERSAVAVLIEPHRLPLSSALRRSASATHATTLALTGGDDYELCLSLPLDREKEAHARARQAGVSLTRIGRIEDGRGIRLISATGEALTYTHHGYKHFPVPSR
ncbi:thiamine-phosphate kinase [Nitrococcus mobilis]|uniref:Thiamine-monophosphate kinase n=1 Tax=Nitrococcus mobilis Nb-231 TaxID=314278 RepID=A4BNK3_9GAMM|nr:thiamine-phosphate kinase [Nitrococcus mobilis]EAR22802.1 Thiamine-monophosphate kinase [Nitrococcus mobilis Nb-231]